MNRKTKKTPRVSVSSAQGPSFILEAVSSGYVSPYIGPVPPKTYHCIPGVNPGTTCYYLHRGFFGKYKVLEVEMCGYYFTGTYWRLRLCRPGAVDVFADMSEIGKTLFSSRRAAVVEAEKNNRLRRVKVEYIPR